MAPDAHVNGHVDANGHVDGGGRGSRAATWVWGPAVDLGVFVAPTAVALALVLASRTAGFDGGELPGWAWVALVLSVDVAHVWATLYRTYLDPIELRRRPWLYALVPLGCWAAGAALYARSPLTFWRALAYLAVLHFVRQQVGWAAIYRARAGRTGLVDRVVDDAAIYLSTGVPLLVWHARLPRPFVWFVDGDFVPMPWLERVVPVAEASLVAALVVFAARHAWSAWQGRGLELGKIALVVATAVGWYGGIVLAGDDLTFTALNVLPHGVPYFALLWAYARARARREPALPASRVVALGLAPFLASLLLFAFVEEALWDRLVWHDREWLFGFAPELHVPWHAALVPLLALPQSTHYALDAVLWRRGEAGPELAEALGFVKR